MRIRAFLLLLFTALLPGASRAAALPLEPTAFGFYHEAGTFFSSTSHAVGWHPYSNPAGELRNFFVFDLSGVNENITHATLRLSNPVNGYTSPDPSETFALFDVSTDLASLAAGTGGMAAFGDLGTGTEYGSVTVDATSNGTTIEIPLNAAGIDALNAATSLVGIGGALTTINYANTTLGEWLFNNTSGALTRELVLTTPEPDASAQLALASAIAAALARRRAQRPGRAERPRVVDLRGEGRRGRA